MPRPAMSGAEPWMGSNNPPRAPAPSDAEGNRPEGAREHGGLVGDNVAEHILGHDDVEISRPLQEVHGG